jgi:hypothetical protein
MDNKNNEEKQSDNIPFYFFVSVFSIGFLVGLVYIIYALFF